MQQEAIRQSIDIRRRIKRSKKNCVRYQQFAVAVYNTALQPSSEDCFTVSFCVIDGCLLTGPCPEGLVSYDRSAPAQGPGGCAPIWSWLRYWPASEPSEARANSSVSESSMAQELTKPNTNANMFVNVGLFLFVLRRVTCSNVGGHPLCLRCLTIEIWRPKLRCTEQHSSQIRTPLLILVHPGSEKTKTQEDDEMI